MSNKSDITPVSFLLNALSSFLSSTARTEGVSLSLNDLNIKQKVTKFV